MQKFSVVVPIYNESKLMQRTIPAYLALNPTELIIVQNNPPIADVDEVAKKMQSQNKKIKLLYVKEGEGWRYTMAKVRRLGFEACSEDVIFTGDVDCVPTANCKKAIEMVGKNGIGLVSVSRFHNPSKIIDIYRLFGYCFIKLYVHRFAKRFGATSFSGCYSVYRPYWLDSEPREAAMNLQSVKQKMRRGDFSFEGQFGLSSMGEDSHLRDYMQRKHKVVYLDDIGAFVLSDPYENNPVVQFWKGQYFAQKGRGLLVSLARVVLRGQPHYLRGFCYERRRMK